MVLHLFISSLFIDDLIDKEFMFALNENRVWRVEGLIREELVVVLEEWADFGYVKDRESVRCVQEVEHYCGVVFVS
jgi:hypothetical protein